MKPSDLPPESSPTARLITVLGFVIVTAVLYLAKEVLIPIALAVLLAFLFSPIVLWLERRGLKRAISVVALVVILIGLVGGLGYLLAGQFVEFVDNLPRYRSNIVSKIHTLKPGRESVFKRAEAMIADISQEVEKETTGTATSQTTGSVSASTVSLHGVIKKDEPKLPDEPREKALLEMSGQLPELEKQKRKEENDVTAAHSSSPANPAAIPVRVVEGPETSWQSFKDILGPIANILGTAGLVILIVIFLLLQREDLRDRVIRLAGYNKVRVTTEALEEAASRVGRYLLMQLIVNVTYGIPVAIGLYFIGVPNAMLWGAMATILRFIPYIGPWIAALMPVALSLAVFDNWTMPLLTIGLFVVLELVSNNMLEPILYGHSTGVSPVAIIVSAVFWTWLWGPVGLVLATPITVCLVVLGRHIPHLAFLHVLLGDEPVLTDDARVYNRLLSGAVDDAVDIAGEYAAENSVPDLYDNVILPALASAETDRNDELLTPSRYEKFITGMQELLEEISERLENEDFNKEGSGEAHNTKDAEGDTDSDHERAEVRPERRVMCIPVNDNTDECAATMLQHLLRQRGDDVRVTPAGLLASEIVKSIQEYGAQVVVLSSVPPFAVTHTRYLTKKILSECPDVKLFAGMWHNAESADGNQSDSRLKNAGIEQVYTSIKDAGMRI